LPTYPLFRPFSLSLPLSLSNQLCPSTQHKIHCFLNVGGWINPNWTWIERIKILPQRNGTNWIAHRIGQNSRSGEDMNIHAPFLSLTHSLIHSLTHPSISYLSFSHFKCCDSDMFW
jgi:hypothetical protein